ncbi:hypothetical protein [Ostreibacterium oceani]|uniref:DUF1640 domain-containing protein n=1 Tax=Ostreibacterium oceani TaxID=2654998 RepID=A0A6N7F2X6_9GAMM|nr:hypothetical protein [Ostreibacterium oceani]MPV86216.1 hypothetical protein [Ostreibacterium oceani]
MDDKQKTSDETIDTTGLDEATVDVLPLSVREHLMRGNQALAVTTLQAEKGLTQAQAEQEIEDYKASLRQRKLELDIQIMNAENRRDSSATVRKIVTWAGYLIILLLTLFALNMIIKM